jgi:hypothetical protein
VVGAGLRGGGCPAAPLEIRVTHTGPEPGWIQCYGISDFANGGRRTRIADSDRLSDSDPDPSLGLDPIRVPGAPALQRARRQARPTRYRPPLSYSLGECWKRSCLPRTQTRSEGYYTALFNSTFFPANFPCFAANVSAKAASTCCLQAFVGRYHVATAFAVDSSAAACTSPFGAPLRSSSPQTPSRVSRAASAATCRPRDMPSSSIVQDTIACAEIRCLFMA